MTIAALAGRGYTLDDDARLYPEEVRASPVEAIELERSIRTAVPAA